MKFGEKAMRKLSLSKSRCHTQPPHRVGRSMERAPTSQLTALGLERGEEWPPSSAIMRQCALAFLVAKAY
jgi:hypothetical protein